MDDQHGQKAARGKAGWKEDAQAMRRRHLVEALTAFQNVLEAHQRLAALMASRSALAPLLNCIEPACRSVPNCAVC